MGFNAVSSLWEVAGSRNDKTICIKRLLTTRRGWFDFEMS
jgi:hypothetical protein